MFADNESSLTYGCTFPKGFKDGVFRRHTITTTPVLLLIPMQGGREREGGKELQGLRCLKDYKVHPRRHYRYIRITLSKIMYNLVKIFLELVDSITINNICREFIPNVTNLVSEEIYTQAGVVSFQFYFPSVVSNTVTTESGTSYCSLFL